ncbi:MAG: sulfatase [Verrucomicrobiota bacterium]
MNHSLLPWATTFTWLSILFSLGANDRPNILLILADDLGWSDLACYGNPWFETPHLDRLAREGARFPQAYAAAPICSASRAALLTGKTTARLGFEFVTKPKAGYQELNTPLLTPPFTLDLPLAEVTLAEMLAGAGYTTGFFGKWHLNQHYERYLGWSPTHGPNAQGFQIAEEDFGNHPYSYWSQKKNRIFEEHLEEGTFLDDSLTQRAIRFLERDHQDPFFLMVSHFYVHDPNHTRLKWLHDRYVEKIPPRHPRRDKIAHYGAMVTTLDHHVGELLTALRQGGMEENTLVVFTSDNGGHPNYAGNAPLRGSKWNLYEGGIRVPFLVRWPSVVAPDAVVEAPVWSLDLFPTFANLAQTRSEFSGDGIDLLPLLRNPEITKDESWKPSPMIWHFPYYHPEKGYADAPENIGVDDGYTSQTKPHSAIRVGSRKLLHFYEDGQNESYQLREPPLEQADESQSGITHADLNDQLIRYLDDVGARLPEQNPQYSPPTPTPIP